MKTKYLVVGVPSRANNDNIGLVNFSIQGMIEDSLMTYAAACGRAIDLTKEAPDKYFYVAKVVSRHKAVTHPVESVMADEE